MRSTILIHFLLTSIVTNAQVIISEAGAFGGLTDATGADQDWIELRNLGPETADLSGMHLSDDADDWAAWTFPAGTTLPPGGLMLLAASGRGTVAHWDLAIHEDQTFSYLTSPPPANWREPAFNDVSWPQGVGGFGYGDGDDVTVLPNGTQHVHLRRKFLVADPDEVVLAMLAVDADDSFVAFINGREVARSPNLDGLSVIGSNVVPLLPAEAELYGGGVPEVLVWSPSLNAGWNTFALQVHNNNTNSSDLSARPFLALGLSAPADAGTTPLPTWLAPPAEPIHTNFKLRPGEPIILSAPDGELLDVLTLPADLTLDMSVGRHAAQPSATCVFNQPTPGAPNNAPCFSGIAATPNITPSSGWYAPSEPPITPSATTPPGITLRYTLDGSEPTADDPPLSQLAPLTETTALSIRAFADDMLPGRTITRTYIRQNDEPEVPIASIATDPDHLWDWETGIYVLGPDAWPEYPFLGANFWQPWSRHSRLEWFNENAEPEATAELDLEIHGGWSRGEPQKSFRIDFKNRYTGDLEGPEVFPETRPGLTAFNNLNLRNGGQTSWTNKLQDGFLCNLAIQHTKAPAAAWRPVEVWLNGEYWGVYGAREKTDERWVADTYGIPEQDVDMANQWEPLQGPLSAFEVSVAPLMELNPTSDNFAQAFAQTFDIQAFTDYHIFEIHGQNIDWLSAEWGLKNLKFFRDGAVGGPWRYVLFDLDACFGQWGTAPGHNALQAALNPPTPSIHSDLLEAFLDNPTFRCGFANRYNDLLNSIFEPSSFESRLLAAAGEMTQVMPRHVDRWDSPVSTGFWLDQVNQIHLHNTARIAPSRNHLRTAFGWSPAKTVTTSWSPVGGGTVTVNGLPGAWPSWSGEYFGECPVTLAATPATGFGFTHWTSGAHEGAVWFDASAPFLQASLTTDDTFEAHFEACLTGVTLAIVESAAGGLTAVASNPPAPGAITWWQDGQAIASGPELPAPLPVGGPITASFALGGCTILSGAYGTGSIPIGMETFAPPSLLVYPNPASDIVTIDASPGPLEIFACSSGDLVEVSQAHTIDVSGWAPGIYAVRASNGLNARFAVIP